MRAEEILSVLMDDKKYKAKVEELKAQEAKLAYVYQIAATLEEAQKTLQQAAKKKQEVDAYEKELSRLFEQKIKELEAQAKAQASELEGKSIQQRLQYRDAIEIQSKSQAALALADKRQKQAEAEHKDLKEWELDLGQREDALARKIERLNKAWSG